MPSKSRRIKFPPGGCIPSPWNGKDWHITRLGAVAGARVFPDQFQIVDVLPPAKNQGQTSMCVAFSLSSIQEQNQLEEFGSKIPLSEGFIYGNRLSTDYQGEGMILRQALDRLIKDGVCQKSLMPIVGTYPQCRDAITPTMRQYAPPARAASYGRCYSSDDLMAAMTDIGPVLLGLNIYASFDHPQTGALVVPSTTGFRGGHGTVLWGWKRWNGFLWWLLGNSWGTSWCPDFRDIYGQSAPGYCWLRSDYPWFEAWNVLDFIVQPTPPPALLTPNPPSLGKLIAVSWNSRQLKWSHDGQNVTGFIVERSPNSGQPYAQIKSITDPAARSWTDTGLTTGKYYYRMRAVNQTLQSGTSNYRVTSVA